MIGIYSCEIDTLLALATYGDFLRIKLTQTLSGSPYGEEVVSSRWGEGVKL